MSESARRLPLIVLFALLAPPVAGSLSCTKGTDGRPSYPTSGTILDDFVYKKEIPPIVERQEQSTYARSIYIAPGNTIFVAGDGGGRCLVRKSTDQGATWTTVDDYGEGGVTVNCNYSHIVGNGSGTLYYAAVSYASDSNSNRHWLARKSTDNGATWSNCGSFNDSTANDGITWAIGLDGAGNLYVGGEMNSYSGGYVDPHWKVRKSTDGCATWSEVDSIAGSYLHDLLVTPAGTLYATGTVAVSGQGFLWRTKRSTNGGSTWSTADEYGGLGVTQGDGLALDASGTLLAAGRITQGDTVRFIRRSTDNGASWSIANREAFTDPKFVGDSLSKLPLVSPAAGVFYQAEANSFSNDNTTHWVVRKSTDSGGTWTEIDRYMADNSSEGLGTRPYGIAADSNGKVYVVGSGSVFGRHHWTVIRY